MMRPDIVIIMADQLRYDALGRGYTPNIDALMGESVCFDRAYCASPLCVPSRGAFFTGLCPDSNGSLINPWEPRDAEYGNVRNGIDNLYELVSEDWEVIHSGKQHLFTSGVRLEDRSDLCIRWASTEKTYREMLKKAGVRQSGTLGRFKSLVPETVGGKHTKISLYSNAETGCYPFDEKYYFDRYFTDMALKAIDERKGEKRLFLSAMYLAPHPPLEIPQPWYSKVGPDSFQLPENVGKFYPHQSPLQMHNLTGIIGGMYRKEEWKETWRVYLGLVSMLDDCIGQLVAKLKEKGIYDNAIIVFTADHGEMLGSHSLFQKMCMYEESVRVPLSIKWPADSGVGNYHVMNPVSHLDLMPTLCEAAGITSRNRFEGVSLAHNVPESDRPVFIQYDGNGSLANFQRAVIQGRYKFIADLFGGECFFELYDVVKDRMESNNLMFDPQYDGIAIKLYSLLDLHMKEKGARFCLPKPDFDAFRNNYSSIGFIDKRRWE